MKILIYLKKFLQNFEKSAEFHKESLRILYQNDSELNVLNDCLK
jgi:hypothetical protein